MLDVHAMVVTPGVALVLGSPGTLPTNDGASVAGVPMGANAKLRMYGGHSPSADTIATIRLRSQDQADPINGVLFTPGAASLLNQHFDYTTLTYRKGLREIAMGTNTGVVAGHSYTIDEYEGQGEVVPGSRSMGGEVMTGPVTFSGALTANAWGSQAYAPGSALPNGKYAILGAYVSAIANAALIRFAHPSFRGLKPGFPVANYEIISTSSWDKVCKDALISSEVGQQFIYLSEVLGKPSCPVFEVTNAGTGLTIEMISAQADTPVVNLMLAQISEGK